MLGSGGMVERAESLGDTIVARATGPGEGAIAIVRLAGPRAVEIGRRLSPARGATASHLLSQTRLVGRDGAVLDEAMVVEMHAPRSYTGDDVVELHLHGSRAVVERVLDECVACGARLARAGEFTLRAFLNGRMDLAQAEAVQDLIAARSERDRKAAVGQLAGELSQRVLELLKVLEGVLALWRAAVDFPDELPEARVESLHIGSIDDVRCKIQAMCDRYADRQRSGLRVVLCGAPNVGKSTLLNAWVGEKRVIVDSAPGTTRDPVEVELFDGPIRWSVWDTAGIRRDAEGVEAQGVLLAIDKIRQADVALWLVNPSSPIWPEGDVGEIPMSVVGAKSDVATPDKRRSIEEEARSRGMSFMGWVSVRTGEGVSGLRDKVTNRLGPASSEDSQVLVRRRHIDAMKRSVEALDAVLAQERERATIDVLSMELEEACRALGAVLGRDVDRDVLDRIFSEFCIGK